MSDLTFLFMHKFHLIFQWGAWMSEHDQTREEAVKPLETKLEKKR